MSIFVLDKFELEENRGEERRAKESRGEHRIAGWAGESRGEQRRETESRGEHSRESRGWQKGQRIGAEQRR